MNDIPPYLEKKRSSKSGQTTKQPKPGAVVAGYVRRSEVKYPPECVTVEQREAYDRDLISNYQARIRERATAKGMEVAKWFIDLDISGREYALKKRAAYHSLFAEIEAGTISHVFTTETSRMHRDNALLQAFRKLCKKSGVVFDAPNLVLTGNEATDNLMASVIGATDELYSDLTSQRIIEHNYQAVKTGQWAGSSCDCWGLKYSREKKGFFVDDRTAPFVRLIFDLFIQHGGVAQRVANDINAMLDSADPRAIRAGFHYKQGHSHTNSHGKWTSVTILRIVRAPRYQRIIDYQPGIESLPRLRIYSPDLIPEIVPPDIAEQVQRLLILRYPVGQEMEAKRKAGRLDQTWGGLLRCAACGSRLTSYKPTSWIPGEPIPWLSWRCIQDETTGICNETYGVQQRRIAALVGAALREWLDGIQVRINMPLLKPRSKRLVMSLDKAEAGRALESLGEQRKRVYEAYRRSLMDIDTLESELAAIGAEEDRLKEQVAARLPDTESPELAQLTRSQVSAMIANIDTLFAATGNDVLSVPLHLFLKEIGLQAFVKVASLLNPEKVSSKARRGGKVTLQIEMHRFGMTRQSGRALTITESDAEFNEYQRWRFTRSGRDRITGRWSAPE